MIWIAWALVCIGGIVTAAVLVMNGHPWFAFLVLMAAGCVGVKSGKDGAE